VNAKGEGIYNVVVIGAGTAGLVTAAATAGLGGRVALVERNRMGGDCLNTGCVPSKALISSARLVAQIRRAPDWGLEPMDPRFDFARVFERMRERRAKIAPHDSQERFESLGVDVFRGHARFLSPREVDVDGRRLTAKNFVIATGSRPAVPSVPGLSEVPYFTNETVFDELREKPARLVVLGGGPVGCELGQVFVRLGVRVTIVQRPREILEKEDADASGLVRRVLEQEGVTVLVGAQARRASRNGGAVRVEIEIGDSERRMLDADAILVAAGRVANTDDLGLEAAGVAQGKNGVTVNAHLQTSQPHIYAAGDVVGGYRFTHVADAHARLVARNILFPWSKAKWDDSVVPWCTYTSPEVARVGVNETDARKRGVEFDVWRQPLEDVDRAVVESEETGFAKVLTRKGRDRILGATIVSERAGDLVHELVLAMKGGVGLKKISSTIHAYPTFAEISRRLADGFQKSRLTPGVRRLFAWLYRRARQAR
jgi:pyruvate/2-oxoglutarate dehydrogenase complex dihydrolipoamide dehydrogenase (E3) component